MSDVLARINESDAGVTASYDASNDTIRVISKTLGSRTVRFGGAGDTSNFLGITKLTTATQTAGNDAQFTINGGATLTRNSNSVADAISGVTLNLLSTGTSTVTTSSDDDTIIDNVKKFIDAYNASITQLKSVTSDSGSLAGDNSIRSLDSYLRSNIFNQVLSASGDYQSLADIGISTGENFSTDSPMTLELDEDKFKEALRNSRTNVQALFSNDAEDGIADAFYTYLDSATKTNGFLDSRSKSNGSIDEQIQSLNDQIDQLNKRLEQKKTRMTNQFINMETMMSNYKSSSSSLSGLGSF
jgi:flagellar hook-associated protein 2